MPVIVASGLLVAAGPALGVPPFPFADPGTGTGTQDSAWQYTGNDPLGDTYTSDHWVRLNGTTPSSVSDLVLPTAFPSGGGVQVTFDYRQAGFQPPASPGDGMSMFLLDGSAALPLAHAGGDGGGLGYARGATEAQPQCGLPGAYVGVGLDVYGEFADSTQNNRGGQPGRTQNAVTVRGSGTGDCPPDPKQYPFVALHALAAGTEGFVLTGPPSGPTVASDPASDPQSMYRRVRVTLDPSVAGVGLTVEMTPAAVKTAAPGAFSTVLTATLNGVAGQAPLPASLRLGFGAGSGQATSFKDIRNVEAVSLADPGLTAALDPSTPGAAGLPAGTFRVGDQVKLDLVATDHGPGAIGSAPDGVSRVYDDLTSTGLASVGWTCTGLAGATCAAASGSGPVVSAEWGGPVGSSVSVVVTGTVTAASAAKRDLKTTAILPTDFGANTVSDLSPYAQKDLGALDRNLTNNTAQVSFHAAYVVGLTATATSAHPPSRFGWYRSPVTVTFACSPGGAQLTTSCPSPVTLAANARDQSVSRTISDGYGTPSTAGVSGINIDQVRPKVQVSGIANDAIYPVSHPPTARCKAVDRVSGVASCTLKKHQMHTAQGLAIVYVATAVDKAGNIRKVTRTIHLR